MKRSLLILAALLAIVGAGACSGGAAPAPAAPPTAAPPAAAPTTVPGGTPANVAGDLAILGKTVFTANCARCHGDQGQGGTAPRLIGSGNALAKYGTAQGLLAFISTNMPKSSPGSLRADQYVQVLAFLLMQNLSVPYDALLDAAKLSGIPIK